MLCAIFSCADCCYYLSDRKKNIIVPYAHMPISVRPGYAYAFAQSNQGFSVRQYFLPYRTVKFEAKDLFRLRVCSYSLSSLFACAIRHLEPTISVVHRLRTLTAIRKIRPVRFIHLPMPVFSCSRRCMIPIAVSQLLYLP